MVLCNAILPTHNEDAPFLRILVHYREFQRSPRKLSEKSPSSCSTVCSMYSNYPDRHAPSLCNFLLYCNEASSLSNL